MKAIYLIILMSTLCMALLAGDLCKAAPEKLQEPTRDPSGPYNLMAQICGINDVLLVWENPVYANPPLGFRIYCNGVLGVNLTGSDITDHMLYCVCEGCHQMYVTAYFESGGESLPSNIVEVTITNNSDMTVPGAELSLQVYPNPSQGQTNIQIRGKEKFDPMVIAVFNVKGQIIRKINTTADNTAYWDGFDSHGAKAVAGIYFIGVKSTQGYLVQKLILTR